MLLTHPALPGPWSGNFCCTCCCAALALFLIRCRESSSIFSKWSSVVDDYRKICLIRPGLLPSTTQKDHPSSSLWPALSCDDSFPIPSYPAPSRPVPSCPLRPVWPWFFSCFSHAFTPPQGMGRKMGGAQEMSLGNHMLKNPKLTGWAGEVFSPQCRPSSVAFILWVSISRLSSLNSWASTATLNYLFNELASH